MRVIYSNKFIAWTMLLLQIFMLVAGYLWLRDYLLVVFGTTTVISFGLIVYETNRAEAPEFKLTWIIIMSIFPIFGALLYIYTSFGFISREIALTHEKVCKTVSEYIPYDAEVMGEIREEEYIGLSRYLKKYANAPIYKNTDVKYYELGEKMYEDMKAEIKKAQKFIFLEFFIVNTKSVMWCEIYRLLSEKVKEGVEVRLMYDGIGSLTTFSKEVIGKLTNAGILVEEFAPVQPLLSTYQNNRDHRKIIVIDGKVAFTGGINIADEYVNSIDRFGHWKDNGIRLKGEAVGKLTALFLEMWSTMTGSTDENYNRYIRVNQDIETYCEGYVIPYGDSPLDNHQVGKRAYIDLINSAKKYVHIMTPYLVLDYETTQALRYAVCRGVEVKIIIPHRPDKVYAYWLAHTYFPELINAGVKIYEYTPGFIHAKTMIVDSKSAIVGTINFDYRSFYLHYECAVAMFDMPVILDIEEDFKDTTKKSDMITMAEYKKFNPFTRLIGQAIRIIAPLL